MWLLLLCLDIRLPWSALQGHRLTLLWLGVVGRFGQDRGLEGRFTWVQPAHVQVGGPSPAPGWPLETQVPCFWNECGTVQVGSPRISVDAPRVS
jgi:hypothetical protein